MINIQIPNWQEHELLDTGNGRKLERFGKYILNRIEPQATWHQTLSESEWHKADAVFRKASDRGGNWELKKQIPGKWTMSYESLKLELRLTPFGHVGVFPDQSNQWEWISNKIKQRSHPEPRLNRGNLVSGSQAETPEQVRGDKAVNVLSLFTYTGASTLEAAAAGAHVTHVDASKPAITWARENQRISGLTDKPIRWIPEDALKFVKREVRRNSRYDAIIMDPPKFGRGTQGEVWKFEESFPELIDYCRQILSDNPLFILTTAYAIPVSSISLANMISDATRKLKGNIEYGELALKQTSNEKLLPTAIFCKWER
ncbi:MAG TPA: class I SAM-dependent methyltransferase [Patescibacteria group bacterium]|nr:class I SAM-dependent methyltransferase [Patescibacteria group bacterium]